MDLNLLVTLLTITVVLLSLVIITLLVIGIMVMVKVKRLVRHIDAVVHNVAEASEWLAPSKVIGHIVRLFK